jgi:hypothetical protein
MLENRHEQRRDADRGGGDYRHDASQQQQHALSLAVLPRDCRTSRLASGHVMVASVGGHKYFVFSIMYCLPKGVANARVTVDAQRHFFAIAGRCHLMDRRGMAVQACFLRHAPIPGLNLNGFVEVLQSECQRVEKTIVRFCHQFAEQVMRQMTIVADGHMAVAGMLPGIVVSLHDVTVGARRRIAHQVAVALAIAEREYANATKNSERGG